MRRLVSLAGSVLFATLLLAQQDPKKPASAAERRQAIEEKQQQIVTDWRKAREVAAKAAKEAPAGTNVPQAPASPDFAPVIADAEAAAKDYAGSDDAVQFLLLILFRADSTDLKKRVLGTLIAKHVDSPALTEVGGMMPYLDRVLGDPALAKQALESLAASKNANVSGWAAFARLAEVIETAPLDQPEYAAAKQALLAVAAKADNEELKSEINTAIETREKYGVGVMAPDIEGEDLDGVAFKLSDYKGKILFLDFWGDW